MTASSWKPLRSPRVGSQSFEVSDFTRLARTHATVVAGDTLVAIALAGTLFFSIDVGEARGEVFLYLALTMAPFAVVAPLVGPALDRALGGRRWVVIGCAAVRAVVCVLMIDLVDSLLLFPAAFVVLVGGKAYQVAKSALVPSVVPDARGLVEANSKLAVISGVVGAAAAVPGGALLAIGGSEAVLVLAAGVFAAGTVIGWRVPNIQVAAGPDPVEAREELRGSGVLLAASAMGLLRGIVGFLTFLLAFSLRSDDAPSWHFGLVLGLSAVSALSGAAIAPRLRSRVSEERIITGSLGVVAAVAVAGTWVGGLVAACLVAAAVGVGAASAKQGFDSIVQRDAPDANRGRSFARFETRFQLIWVLGAVLGVVPIPAEVGYAGIGVVAAFAAVSYRAGSRGARLSAMRRLDRIRERRRLRHRGHHPESESADSAGDLPPVPPSIALPEDREERPRDR